MAAGFFGQRTGSLEELALVLLVLLILLLIAGALLVLLVLLLIVLLLILLIVLLLILLPAVLLLVLFVRHDDNLHTFTHSEIFDESSGNLAAARRVRTVVSDSPQFYFLHRPADYAGKNF